MAIPEESDPLLPRGQSAPEISGHGFSRPLKVKYESRPVEVTDQTADDIEAREQSGYNGDGLPIIRILIIIFTTVVGFAFIVTLLVPRGFDVPWHVPKNSSIKARTSKILSENPLIDGHDDLAILIRFAYQNDIYNKDFTGKFEQGGMQGQVDLPRLEAGKSGGAFWSAFTLCPANGTDFSDENYAGAVSQTLSQLDLLHRLTAAYPRTFSNPTLTSEAAHAAFKNESRLVSPIGIEGLHQIGNSFSNLRLYHALGVKYATLTHNCHNAFADAALTTNSQGQTIAGPPYWGGLSKGGESIVEEMNRMGMIVDLAHVSKDTMLDVLGARPDKFSGSKAPIMFSHSSAYALCPHPRNVPDDVLRLVKETGSIVMINFSPDFISCVPSNSETGIPDLYPPNATLHQVAKHITYIGDLIGYDHVGIGSDFDGIPTTPTGLEHVGKFPDLVGELLRMGVSDSDAAKTVGLNILRVWADVEKTTSKMQRAGTQPIQDRIPKYGFSL